MFCTSPAPRVALLLHYRQVRLTLGNFIFDQMVFEIFPWCSVLLTPSFRSRHFWPLSMPKVLFWFLKGTHVDLKHTGIS